MNSTQTTESRDRAIEDATNLWLIHPLARAGLTPAIRLGVSANMASVIGLICGVGAAAAYLHWRTPLFALCGLALSIGWLVADGLDGMIARATGTSSAAGRVLDGLCDHGVFLVLYLALGWSVGFGQATVPMLLAGVAHAVQSSLYEAERARYHRRTRGDGMPPSLPPSRNPGVRLYNAAFGLLDRIAEPFDRKLRASSSPAALAARYREAARRPMKSMALLSANTRVWAIFIACVAGSPAWFWWFEIGPLTLWAAGTMIWHRRVESRLGD